MICDDIKTGETTQAAEFLFICYLLLFFFNTFVSNCSSATVITEFKVLYMLSEL